MSDLSGWAQPQPTAPSSAPGPSPAPAPPEATAAPAPRPSRRWLVAAVAGLAVVGLAALLLSRDGGTDPKAIRHAIAVALEGQGMPAADATCVAERVVDTMGTKDLGKIDDFSASSVPDGLTKGFAADFAAALQAGAKACDASFGAD